MTEKSQKLYRCPIEVRGYELDSFGHVNHAVYLSYLEHARWKLLEQEGITLARFSEWKRWPIIAGVQIEYLKPTYLGEQLEVRTRTLSHGRTHLVVSQEIVRGDTAVLRGQVRIVLVNEKGRPAEMPPLMSRLWEDSSEAPRELA